MGTSFSSNRAALPSLLNSMTSQAPSVMAVPTSTSPSSSSRARRPTLRWRAKICQGRFLHVPLAVAMKM